ncbi:MAG: 2,3-bisphosphoglycerate-independent phosphoglycerate mutase [Clostridia bacterium]|nr:2,3-bisphosphoglycerate-independent phosphoglycerate mutase [Clostridia bacterium]
MNKTPTTLIIMDGYGLAEPGPGNAIARAETPVLDRLTEQWPHTQLQASGEDVGLPEGQIGNSEVGHTNIGAGRIVYQELTHISNCIKNGSFFENPALCAAMDSAVENRSSLHLLGLISDGGVHSHITHTYALLEMAKRRGVENVYIHCFLDGRDVPPTSGAGYIRALAEKCRELGVGAIATVMGRFYGMDRDRRWERIERAYNAMVFGEAPFMPDAAEAVERSYELGVTDEFMEPVLCAPDGLIGPNDSIIFMNFRPDRAREITRTFVDEGFSDFERREGYFPVKYVCMTQYDADMPNVEIAYPPQSLANTFGEFISKLGMTEMRIAETEKYAHVTFFFNGGVEAPYEGEDRVLVPSPKEYDTYDLIPEMSAFKVAEETCAAIRSGEYDIVVVNFANCDMVGHTGVFEAAVKAVETVDECVGRVVEATSEMGGIAIITADHGNADCMLEEDGVTPHTAHTTAPVPFIIVGAKVSLREGRLCDIAPTMLDLMGLEKPEEMTGSSLIV